MVITTCPETFLNREADVVNFCFARRRHACGQLVAALRLVYVAFLLATPVCKFNSPDKLFRTTHASHLVPWVVKALDQLDKPEFQNTLIAKEGLWQRLNLLCMYLPLFYVAIMKLRP